MTLKELLTNETWNLYGDMDVYNDCTDDDYPAWCGALPTEEGAEHFEFALGCEAHIITAWGMPAIEILINHRNDWRTALKATQNLMCAMAGYCDSDDYDIWFTESEEEEPEPIEEVPVENKLYKLEQREGALLTHAWATVNENIYDFAEVLFWCGYTKDEAKELVARFSIDDSTVTDKDVFDAVNRAYRR